MPVVKLRGLGEIGIITDDEPYDLEANAWSAGNNVRFRHGNVERHKGYRDFFTPSVAPYGLLPYQATTGDYYWLYPGLDKCYVYDGSSHYNLTRQSGGVDVDYTGDADDIWTGGVLGNVPILNNGVDDPQYWSPISTSQRLQDLANWPASTTCKVLRPFRNYLVALDVTKSGTRFPTLVKWSSPADPGAVPSSWDETDASEQAGEQPIGDSGGYLVDAVPLRDVMVLYKEDEVWSMAYVAGDFIFSFQRMFKSRGLLAPRCAREFFGRHFVVADGDVYIHDGQREDSIIERKWKDALFNLLDKDNYRRSFVVPNLEREEMWFCFPEEGETTCTKAFVWNWRTGAQGIRDLPDMTAGEIGIVNLGGGSRQWNDDLTLSWDDAEFGWSDRSYDPISRNIVGSASGSVYEFEQTNQEDGTNFRAYAERVGLNLTDDLSATTITAIYPRLRGKADFYVGGQYHPDDAITWHGPFAYDSDTDRKIDCLVTGVYHGIRVESEENNQWVLSGLNIHHEMNGLR